MVIAENTLGFVRIFQLDQVVCLEQAQGQAQEMVVSHVQS